MEISGRKKLTQLLIPRFHGDYDIEPIEFSYFDVIKKKYVILKKPGFKIKVNKVNNQVSDNSNFNPTISKEQQEDVEIISDNIHHIRNKTVLYDSDPIFGTKLYWSIISSIPLSLIFILIILSNKNKFTDHEKIKLKKIIKEFNNGLNKLDENIDQIGKQKLFMKKFIDFGIFI